MHHSDVEIPHLRLPFRIDAHGADVVEQDSEEDIYQCLLALLRCPKGARPEQPEYGIDQFEFGTGDLDEQRLLDEIQEWEPRATVFLTENPDEWDRLLRHIRVEFQMTNREDEGG